MASDRQPPPTNEPAETAETTALRACLTLVAWLKHTRSLPGNATDKRSAALWRKATRLAHLAVMKDAEAGDAGDAGRG